jgi:hypothetical protein
MPLSLEISHGTVRLRGNKWIGRGRGSLAAVRAEIRRCLSGVQSFDYPVDGFDKFRVLNARVSPTAKCNCPPPGKILYSRVGLPELH